MDIEKKQDSKIFGSDNLGPTFVNKRDLVTNLFDKSCISSILGSVTDLFFGDAFYLLYLF